MTAVPGRRPQPWEGAVPGGDGSADDAAPLRLPLDTAAERSLARLRAILSGMVTAAGITMLLLEPSALGVVLALLILLLGIGWFFGSLRTWRRASRADGWYLEVDREGLLLAEGRRRHQMSWEEVLGIEVDEETLRLSVLRQDGPPMAIHPRYGGVGIYELRDILREARRRHGRRAPGDEDA